MGVAIRAPCVPLYVCFPDRMAGGSSGFTFIDRAGAVADTDVPDTLEELIKQRRRWINGASFSGVYYAYNFFRMLDTDHSRLQKVAFFLQGFFSITNSVMSWFLVGSLLLSFMVIFFAAAEWVPQVEHGVRFFVLSIYAILLFSMVRSHRLTARFRALARTRISFVDCSLFSLLTDEWTILTVSCSPSHCFWGYSCWCRLSLEQEKSRRSPGQAG